MKMREIIDTVNEGLGERLVEGEASGGWLYHVTAHHKLPLIRQQGLTPNTDREPTFDGYPVHGRLYVAIGLADAEFYGERLREFDEEPVFLRFPKGRMQLHADEFGNIGDRYITCSIPPKHIEVLQANGSWEPLV